MHHCPRCQNSTLESANFCHSCGTMLRAYCTPCRLPLPSKSSFCFNCGLAVQTRSLSQDTFLEPSSSQPLEAPNSIPVVAPSRSSLQSEGERKLVSIVFADISGFTAMSEKLDPERVTDIMNHCFKRLGDCVYRFDGYIDKFMGDCIMALFGAPVAHENDPELAVNCGLNMLEELKTFNQEHHLDLGMSVGINSGVVIAGYVGTDNKREYTVMGDPVNLAQRLESAAGRNQILVSRSIMKATENLFLYEKLEPIFVKGKDDKVEIFSALSKKDLRVVDRGQSLELRELVGREEEMKIAREALEKSASGNAQVLAVSGEAGSGKSRLKHEIQKTALTENFLWFESKCQILQKENAYFVIRNLIESILYQDARSNRQGEEPSFLQLKELSRFKLDHVSEHLIKTEILKVPDASKQAQPLSAEQKKKAVFLALKKLFYHLCKKRPCVLYFEDLHWIDSLSKEFLGYLMQSLRNQQLLVYVGFRPDFSHNWQAIQNFTEIGLQPLNGNHSLELARKLLKVNELPSPLENLILERSDGNPLYIEEILKNFVDAGALHKKEGQWVVELSRLTDAEVPSTLRGLIDARLDKLNALDKEILQVAAVIGRSFPLELLKRAVDQPELVKTTIENWKSRELVLEQGADAMGPIFVFRHAMTQEVAFESILKKRRRKIHERVAYAIEELSKDIEEFEIESQVEALSYHFTNAEIAEKAIFYLRRAGDRLQDAFACEDAIKKYQLAIQLQEKEDQSSLEAERILVDLYGQITQPLFLLHEFDEANTYQYKILQTRFAKSDLAIQAKTFRILGDAARHQGRIEEAMSHLKVAVEYAVQAGNLEDQFRAYKAFGNLLKKTQDNTMALDYLQRAKQGALQIQHEHLYVECLNDLATVFLNRGDESKGDLSQAEEHLKECIQFSEDRMALASIRISAILNLGVVHYFRKEFDEALAKFQEAYQMSEQIGDMRNLMIAKHNVGEVQKEFGDYSGAVESFEKAGEWAKELGNNIEQVNNQVLVAYLRTKLGEGERGERELLEIIQKTEELGYGNHLCDALQYLARYYAEMAAPEKAREFFERALEIAEKHNIKFHLGQIQEALRELDSSRDSQTRRQEGTS